MSQPRFPNGTVVTIGNFDGVHLGHQALLNATVNLGNKLGIPSVVLTFTPHPAFVHHPDTAPPLITSYDYRNELVLTHDPNQLHVLEYCLEFAAQTDEQFVQAYLVGQLNCKVLLLGPDARFGHGKSGDLAKITALGAKYGFTVLGIDEVDIAGLDSSEIHNGTSAREGSAPEKISSTAIRAAIGKGDIPRANAMLGRSHSIAGEVVHGAHRGTGLGFPTANLGDIEGMVPGDGVYAGYLNGMPAAISIGTNPTFAGASERHVEAHVIGKEDLNFYGNWVSLEFLAKVRDTEKFESIDALIAQMRADVVVISELAGHARTP